MLGTGVYRWPVGPRSQRGFVSGLGWLDCVREWCKWQSTKILVFVYSLTHYPSIGRGQRPEAQWLLGIGQYVPVLCGLVRISSGTRRKSDVNAALVNNIDQYFSK